MSPNFTILPVSVNRKTRRRSRHLSMAGKLLPLLLFLFSFSRVGAQEVYATSQSNTVNGLCVLCGVVNPNNPVNNANLADYSEFAITSGLTGANVEQTFVFPAINTKAGADSLIIRIGADNTTLTPALFGGVVVESYNGAIGNSDAFIANTTNGIRIVEGGTRAEIIMKPRAIFDRVKLTLSSTSVGALQGLKIYYAYTKKATGPDANGILYVKKGSTGGGSSWSSAIGELADALKEAQENPAVEQIWVAGGTYHPLYMADETAALEDAKKRSFLLKNNIKLYGSFAGTETALSQRNLALTANQTILSGDIDDNDPPSGPRVGPANMHIIIASEGTFVLDGFAVYRGDAGFPGIPMTVDGKTLGGDQGGGMAVLNASVAISNCRFKANFGSWGGAIYGNQSSLTISNSVIAGNHGINGVAIFGKDSRILLVNSTVAGNAANARVIINEGTPPVIVNSIIYGNMVEPGAEAIVSNSIVRGGHTGAGNSGDHPLFIAQLHYNIAPSIGGNYNLQPGSPARNKGDNSQINALVTDPLNKDDLADALSGSGCSGLLCSVANPGLSVDKTNYQDYALLNIPVGLIGVLGTAHLDVSWTRKSIRAGDFVGFVIAQNNLPLDQTLLSNIKIQLMDGDGTLLTEQEGFTSFQTTTLDGQTVSYIGMVAGVDAVTARIHLTQLVGLLTSIRVLGAFTWPHGLPATLTKDLAGNPRVSGSSVDIGAYELQVLSQSITVGDITKTYGDADFKPGFTASSGLTVKYTSTDNNIAEPFQDILDNNAWKLKIKKAGTVAIKANQEGNNTYDAAPEATFNLVINPMPVEVGVSENVMHTKRYDGNAQGTIPVTDLVLRSGAFINEDEATIGLSSSIAVYDNKNAGANKTLSLQLSDISITGADAANYQISNIGTLVSSNKAAITPAPLTITADPQSKVYNTSDPSFTYTQSNMVPGDILSGALSRDGGENAGVYAITRGTLDAGSNYAISFAGNYLTITKAQQAITWNQADIEVGCDGVAPIQLQAGSNSGLDITYVVANTNLATVTGNVLSPVRGGATTITATQPGNNNYEAATAVVKNFTYKLASAVRQQWNDVLVFDNSGDNYIQWQWYKNGSAIGGANKPYYSEATALNGTYYVIATDKTGLAVPACPLTTSGTVTGGIKVSPNPAKAGSMVTVSCNYTNTALQGAKLVIANMNGTVLQQIATVTPATQVQLPAAGGIYVITLIFENGQRATVNVLVK